MPHALPSQLMSSLFPLQIRETRRPSPRSVHLYVWCCWVMLLCVWLTGTISRTILRQDMAHCESCACLHSPASVPLPSLCSTRESTAVLSPLASRTLSPLLCSFSSDVLTA